MTGRRSFRQTFLAGGLFLFMGLTAGVATFAWTDGPVRQTGATASADSPVRQTGATASADGPGETAVTQRMRVIQAEHTPLDWRQRLISLGGLAALLGLCWAVSNNRRRVDWRLVAWGTGLQLAFAVLVLKTAPGLWLFARLNDGVSGIL